MKTKTRAPKDATVQWHTSLLRWVVGLGSYWSGERMTRAEARREAARRNNAGERPKD